MPTKAPRTKSSRAGMRSVHARLDPVRFRVLSEQAASVGLGVDDLASVFLGTHLDRIAAEAAMTGLALRLPVSSLDPGAAAPSSDNGARANRARRDRTSRGDADQSGRPGTALHDEIVNVLRDQGRPITVSEIAEEIRRRGNYHPPRSARPVSGAVVSRRVSNPNYRTLFQRSGGRVGLAPK